MHLVEGGRTVSRLVRRRRRRKRRRRRRLRLGRRRRCRRRRRLRLRVSAAGHLALAAHAYDLAIDHLRGGEHEGARRLVVVACYRWWL
jgi:hypothetical protein